MRNLNASFLFALLLFLASASASAQTTLLGWDFNPLTGGMNNFGSSPYTPTTIDPGVSSSGLVRGAGIGTIGTGAANAWGGNDFITTNLAAAITANDFATFTITPGTGQTLSLSSIEPYNIRRSGTGPTTGQWQYAVGASPFTNILTPITWGAVTTAAGNAQAAIDLSVIPALQNIPSGTTVTFRVVAWDGSGSPGTWYFNDPAGIPGIDLEVRGTLVPDLTTGAITGAPFSMATCAATASGSVAYNSVSTTFTGNTFTVQLSDLLGDFTGAPTIGTLVSNVGNGSISITIPAGLPSGTGYRMRVVSSNPALIGVQSAAFTINQLGASCSTSPFDFFRSQATGDWSTPATWQSSSDNATWITSTRIPSNSAASIFIRSTDSIRVSNARTANLLTVDGALAVVTGGTLTYTGATSFTAGARYYHEINGGALPSATWNATSTCEVRGMTSTAPSNLGQLFGNFTWNNTGQSAFVNINNASFGTQGLFTMRATGVSNLALTGATPTSYTYQFGGFEQTGGVFNLCFLSVAGLGLTTLEVSGNLTVTAGTFSFGAGTNNPVTPTNVGSVLVAGNLTVDLSADFHITGSGANQFGLVRMNAAGAQNLSVSGAADRDKVRYEIASGSETFLLQDLQFSSGNQCTVLAGGILDAGVQQILTAGTMTVEGTLRTANVNGLIGTGTGTIGSGVTFSALPAGATIVYNRSGDQVVSTGLTYRNLVLSGTGIKTASGALTITASTATVQSGATLSLSGVAGQDFNLNATSALVIDAGGTFDNGGESQITGTPLPAITIQGRFITRDAQGFTGIGSAIPGAPITLGAASTIEYGRLGDQNAQDAAYHNLTFSGSGTKTTPTIATVTGTVTMADNVVVNAGNTTLGGVGTNLTMTGSARFITAGVGVKPDMTGTYTLSPTSTIEFTNNALTLQSIRLAPLYANLDINGTNVGTTTVGTGLTLQSSGVFTIRTGATFSFQNANGFSGGANTAISNTNAPAILLQPSSTVAYVSSSDQQITNASAYQNVRLGVGGNKSLVGFTNIEGVLTIEGSALLVAGANTLQLRGNWVSITAGASFSPGTGAVVLNGSAAQTLSASNGTIEFQTLTVNNAGSGVSLVNTNATIGQQLTLTNGVFAAPDASLSRVDIAAGAVVVGGSSTSYIEGWCRKTGNTAFTFPLGRDGIYAPVGISAPSLSTDHFTAIYLRGANPFDVTSRDVTLERIGNCEHWEINRTNGVSSVAITMSFDPIRSCGINVEADLRLARWDGAQWRDMGVASLDIPGQTITSPLISTFSPFTLGSTTIFNPLPVDIAYFYASKPAKGQVALHWANMESDQTLVLERSFDGQNWETLGTGVAYDQKAFTFTDVLTAKMRYYRLADGDTEKNTYRVVSRVLVVQGEESSWALGIYPNPTNGSVRFNLPADREENPQSVSLCAVNGKNMQTYTCASWREAEDWLEKTLKQSEAGLWIVEVRTESNTRREKVLLHR
jgi:hypothetical protein